MLAILRRRPLLGILVAAFLIRCGAAFVVQKFVETRNPPRQFVIEGDANGYWELGQKLSKGEDYEVHGRKILRMPGFPLLLALANRIQPDSLLTARFIMAIVGTFACYVVYQMGTELTDSTTGLIASAWVAISPTLVGFGALLLSETAFAATVMLTLLFGRRILTSVRQRRSVSAVLLAGVLTGIATAAGVYMKPSWILAAPLFCVAICVFPGNNESSSQTNPKRTRTRSLFASLGIITGLVLALLPWAWRNHSVSGHWVFTTLWAGPSLYDGLHPDATGDSDMTFIEQEKPFSTMSEYEVDQHYKDRAVKYAGQNPGHVVQLAFAKLGRYFSPIPNAKQFAGWPQAALALFSFVPLMWFAARGGWVSRRQFWILLFTLGPLLYFAGIHSIFVGSVRYRLPTEYPLAILAAIGVCDWRTKKHFRKNPA